MSTIKTQQNDASVEAFIDTVEDPARQRDCRTLVALFTRASGQTPRMWGDRIVGFGERHYQYANGKPGEICKVGFAPRAKSLAFYIPDFPGRAALLDSMGRHKFSGGCLHIAALEAVPLDTLESIVRKAYLHESVNT